MTNVEQRHVVKLKTSGSQLSRRNLNERRKFTLTACFLTSTFVWIVSWSVFYYSRYLDFEVSSGKQQYTSWGYFKLFAYLFDIFIIFLMKASFKCLMATMPGVFFIELTTLIASIINTLPVAIAFYRSSASTPAGMSSIAF